MSTAEMICDGPKRIFEIELFAHNSVLRCNILLCPEDEGGFSAHCLNLTGVVSEGETEEEAIANLVDAFRETVLYYRSIGEAPPIGLVELDRGPHDSVKSIGVRI
jgi:predicted RNase H-like HicB family nuclease